MSSDSVQVNIFLLMVGSNLEEQIQNAKSRGSSSKTISRDKVEQQTIELDVKETEFFSTSEIEKYHGEIPEKQSFIRDFQVAQWEQVNNNTWNVFIYPRDDD